MNVLWLIHSIAKCTWVIETSIDALNYVLCNEHNIL